MLWISEDDDSPCEELDTDELETDELETEELETEELETDELETDELETELLEFCAEQETGDWLEEDFPSEDELDVSPEEIGNGFLESTSTAFTIWTWIDFAESGASSLSTALL